MAVRPGAIQPGEDTENKQQSYYRAKITVRDLLFFQIASATIMFTRADG